MGVALFIVLDNDDPGFDASVDGKAVGKAADQLNKICTSLALPTIDSFTSMSMDEIGDILGEDIPEAEESWFEPDEGIRLFSALAAHLRSHPDALKRSDQVVEDLEEYISVLGKAKGIDAKWRLSVDV